LVAGGVVLVVAAGVGLRIATNQGASGGVDLALSNLPPGFAATHGAVDFNPVTGTAHMPNFVLMRDGAPVLTAGQVDVSGIGSLVGGVPARVGHVTLHDVTAPPTVRHVDRIEADGLEIANGRALTEISAYPGGKPASTDRKPILGSLEVFGVTLHADPQGGKGAAAADVTIAHDRLENLAARQFATAPTPEAAKDPAFLADVARAISYHDVLMEGFALHSDKGASVTIDSAEVQDYDGGKIGSEALNNVDVLVEKPKGEARFGKLTLSGIDLSRLLDRLPELVADQKNASRTLSGALRISGLTVRDVKFDFAKAPLVTLESVDSHTEYAPSDFSSGSGTLRNFNVVTTGRDLTPQVTQALQNFGMADFSVDIDADGSFDRGTGHLIAKREDINFKGLGTLHLSVDIDGLKPDAPTTKADPTAAFRDARLIHAEVRWDDASLVGRVFHVAALRSGQSETALRATLALPLASAAAFFPDQPDVADQINGFLDGRHSLTITLAPPAPVRLLDVGTAAPNQKAHLLGVKIQGN
jgi:hypothetical protein